MMVGNLLALNWKVKKVLLLMLQSYVIVELGLTRLKKRRDWVGERTVRSFGG